MTHAREEHTVAKLRRRRRRRRLRNTFVMNRRQRQTGKTGAHTHVHTHARTRARDSRRRRRSFARTYGSAVGEEPVLEVRKRTTTTHHRLATALLPLSTFPYKLRAAAVSLSLSLCPSAPLTPALSHTRVYRERLYDRVTLYAVHATKPIVRFAGGKHRS